MSSPRVKGPAVVKPANGLSAPSSVSESPRPSIAEGKKSGLLTSCSKSGIKPPSSNFKNSGFMCSPPAA